MNPAPSETAARNRADFPETARWVDELRAVFGPEVRLLYASEAGRQIGAPGPRGVVAVPYVTAQSVLAGDKAR